MNQQSLNQRIMILCFLVPTVVQAQTAYYAGRYYTPENYPTATYCNCATMCPEIRRQWRAQGWVSGYGSTKVITQPRYRYENRQVKQCHVGPFGRKYCTVVTKRVRVPIKKLAQEITNRITPELTRAISKAIKPPDHTPRLVVDAMLATMQLTKTDILWDIGSGRDARFLITASKRYGCRGIGIEIDPAAVTSSQNLIKEAGLEDKIKIIQGDALKQALYTASKVVIYQHADLQKQIINQLSPNTLIATYGHAPENLSTRTYRVGDQSFYLGVK